MTSESSESRPEWWQEWEARLWRADGDTREWSESELGADIVRLVYEAISAADLTVQSLHDALTKTTSPDSAARLKVMYALFEFGVGRLVTSWHLLRSGYLADAGPLERLAWESILRGAYLYSSLEAAKKYLDGEDIPVDEVRRGIAKTGEESGPDAEGLRTLKDQFSALSDLAHSYSIETVNLQTERSESSPDSLFFTKRGVRRRRELLILVARLIKFLSWIPLVLSALGDALGWTPEMRRRVDKLLAEAKEFEASVAAEFFPADHLSTQCP